MRFTLFLLVFSEHYLLVTFVVMTLHAYTHAMYKKRLIRIYLLIRVLQGIGVVTDVLFEHQYLPSNIDSDD